MGVSDISYRYFSGTGIRTKICGGFSGPSKFQIVAGDLQSCRYFPVFLVILDITELFTDF